MLDITKRYAVIHTVLFGKEKVPHQLFSRLYYCNHKKSMQVENYMLSTNAQARTRVTMSVVWAGSPDNLLDCFEVLHEWSKEDEIRFKALYDELNANLHFKQGKALQTSLF